MSKLSQRHITDIQSLTLSDIHHIFSLATELKRKYKNNESYPLLSSTTVATLFYEHSTRTTLSFQVATQRLHAHLCTLPLSTSSMGKGETLEDTVYSIDAMGIQYIIIRHPDSNMLERCTKITMDSHIINAGSGTKSHPTQSLLDVFTIKENLEKKGKDLRDITIAIAGDIKHSRVAKSNILLFQKLGVKKITLVGPENFIPYDWIKSLDKITIQVENNYDAVIQGIDVLFILRLQKEKWAMEQKEIIEQYYNTYGLSIQRYQSMKNESLILHPGPANHKVEISSDVLSKDRSLYKHQIYNGVFVRMSILLALDSR